MRILTMLDTTRLIEDLPASSHWTSRISYEAVASLLHTAAVRATLTYLYSIAMEYNGPLKAGHAHIDDDRYDKVN